MPSSAAPGRRARCAEEPEVAVVADAEDGVAVESDPLHIGAHRRVANRGAETQAPIFGLEREEMAFEPRAVGHRQLSYRNLHGPHHRFGGG